LEKSISKGSYLGKVDEIKMKYPELFGMLNFEDEIFLRRGEL